MAIITDPVSFTFGVAVGLIVTLIICGLITQFIILKDKKGIRVKTKNEDWCEEHGHIWIPLSPIDDDGSTLALIDMRCRCLVCNIVIDMLEAPPEVFYNEFLSRM